MSAALNAVRAAPKSLGAVTGIAQDNIIFAMVVFAFIVWITTKGELGTYLNFFALSKGQGPAEQTVTASSSTGTTGNAQGGVSGAVSKAVNATGVGSLITAATGAAPLVLGTVPGGLAAKAISGVKSFFGF